MLEREVRMAGAGLTLPSGFACDAGINLFFDGATVSDGAPLAPLRIIDGGRGRPRPDRIRVMRSDADFGVAPATIVTGHGGADSVGHRRLERVGLRRRATCSWSAVPTAARSAR